MNACATYDFRYNADGLTHSLIISYLKGIAKKYTFQLEKGDTGYLHYQGRMSLIKKRRKMEVLPLFKVAPNYFEPTTNAEHITGESFYQQKLDTKVEGPWCDTDVEIYIPRQVREMGDLRPFQLKIVADECVWDTRHINVVYCPDGNIGKSQKLSSYMEYHMPGEEEYSATGMSFFSYYDD